MHALLLLLTLLLAVFPAIASEAGKFSGPVISKWNEDGRTMTLVEDLTYFDPAGRKWTAPKGHVVNGASIPQVAWTFIGGPFEGKYRDSSVIHDVGCDKKWSTWEVVHEVFYMGMITSGVEEWRAKVMYAAVYHLGPRWERNVQVSGIPAVQTPVARQRALEGAAPGSTAEVLSVSPPINFPAGGQTTSTFVVRVSPPQRQMTETQFKALQAEIESAAKSGEPIRSLESIRSSVR